MLIIDNVVDVLLIMLHVNVNYWQCCRCIIDNVVDVFNEMKKPDNTAVFSMDQVRFLTCSCCLFCDSSKIYFLMDIFTMVQVYSLMDICTMVQVHFL